MKELASEIGISIGSLMSVVSMSRTKPTVRFYGGKNMTRPYYDHSGFLAWFKSTPHGMSLEPAPADCASRGELAAELGVTAKQLKALIDSATTQPRVAFYDKRDRTRPRYSRAEFMAWWAKKGAGEALNAELRGRPLADGPA